MTGRLFILMRHDIRLQYRYGIYAAYAFVVFFYVAALYWGRGILPNWYAPLVIFTDPAAVGFFFIGALMMLEKTETVRSAMAITPVRPMEYFWSKALTLSAMAVFAATALTPFLHDDTNWPMLVAIVFLTSVQALGLGVPASLFFKTVTSYLVGAAGWLVPIIGPGFVALLDPMPQWAIIVPSASQLRLIMIATGTATGTPTEISLMFAVAALAAALCIWLAKVSLEREMGQK